MDADILVQGGGGDVQIYSIYDIFLWFIFQTHILNTIFYILTPPPPPYLYNIVIKNRIWKKLGGGGGGAWCAPL